MNEERINDDSKGGYMSCYEVINNDKDGWGTTLLIVIILLGLIFVGVK